MQNYFPVKLMSQDTDSPKPSFFGKKFTWEPKIKTFALVTVNGEFLAAN